MRRGYRDVLAIRDARALIGASAISQLGDWLYNAALLAYVYEATGSAAWVGAATICRLLPYVILGPVGGAVADRYPRRMVLLLGDGLRLVLMLTLAAVVATEGPVLVVIAITALASAAGTAEKPAALAMLPRLVGEVRLGPANALLHTAQDLGVVVGPALGAILLAVGSASTAFLANAVTFAGSALLIATMRRDAAPAGIRVGALTHASDGLRAIRATPFAIVLLVAVAMVELTYGAQTVQLVLYAVQSLDLGAGGYGALLAATGAGGLLSALVNGRLSTSRRVSLVIAAAGVAACGTQLVYAGTGLAAIALAAAVIGGAGTVSSEVVAETALARIAPREALGRIVGVMDAGMVAAMIAGALVAPVVIAATSLRSSLVILGGACVVATLLCGVALRGLDAVSAQRLDALAARVAVLERLPITAGVPRLVLEQLASAAQLFTVPPGVDVVVQGAPAHALYAVVEGRVVVHRDGRTVVHLGAGDSFGERGLLDNAPRNAVVTTEETTKLLRIEGDVLLGTLASAPMLRNALDRSSTAPGVTASAAEPALVDDQRWVKA